MKAILVGGFADREEAGAFFRRLAARNAGVSVSAYGDNHVALYVPDDFRLEDYGPYEHFEGMPRLVREWEPAILLDDPAIETEIEKENPHEQLPDQSE